MNQNNILKYIVPIVAVVVLAESVILISRLNKGEPSTPAANKGTNEMVDQTVTSTPTGEVKTGNENYEISISADKESYKIGESGQVKVVVKGKMDKSVDSVNVYVKYDPSLLDVKELSYDKRLPVPAFSKVSTLRSLLVANFLISDPKGLTLKSTDELTLMSFNFKALKKGMNSFEISTGKEMKESATMIVENGTSKPLTFSSNKLTINVTE